MQSPKTILSPDERLLALVHRASSAGRALRRLLADEAAAFELSDADLLLVWLCDDPAGPGLAQVELAQSLGVSPAQMSATVERLRKRELIEVERSAIDRRRQVWRTTPRGQELLAALRPTIARLAEGLDREIAPPEQLAMGEMCQRVTDMVAEIVGDCPARQEPRPPRIGAAA